MREILRIQLNSDGHMAIFLLQQQILNCLSSIEIYFEITYGKHLDCVVVQELVTEEMHFPRRTGAVLLPEKASLFGLERLAFWCPFEPEKASLLGLDLIPKG